MRYVRIIAQKLYRNIITAIVEVKELSTILYAGWGDADAGEMF